MDRCRASLIIWTSWTLSGDTAPHFLCCLLDLVSHARQSTGNHDAHATGPDGDEDPHSEFPFNTEAASPLADSRKSPANEPEPVIIKRLDPLDLR